MSTKKKPVDQVAVSRSQGSLAAMSGSPAVDTPLTSVVSQVAAPVVATEGDAGPSARWESYGFTDFVKDFAAQETVITSGVIASQYLEHPRDPGFVFPSLDSPEWKQVTEGIDPKKWDALGNAHSTAQLNAIAFRLREEEESKHRLMEGGFLPFFVANIVNPESVLLSMSTGGLDWVRKGTRLARVMKNAGFAAGENLAQEAALHELQDSRDINDVYIAGAAGILLGGAFGALGKGMPDDIRADFESRTHAEIDRVTTLQAEQAGLVEPSPVPSVAHQLALAERNLVEIEAKAHLDAEEARLRGIVDHPNAPVDRLTHTLSDVDRMHTEAKAIRDEAAKVLSGDTKKQVRAEAQRLARADRKNAYAQDRAREKGSAADHVFPEHQAQAEANVAQKRAAAQQQLDAGNEQVGKLKGQLDKAAEIRGAEIDLEALTNARKAAKDTRTKLQIIPERLRTNLTKRLDDADAEIAKAVEGEKLIPNDGTSTEVPTFGPDSASAASIHQSGVETTKFDDAALETAPTRLLGFLPRWDYASILRSPMLPPAIRERVGKYIGDPSPAEGHASLPGASETAARRRDRNLTQVYQVYDPAFKAFIEERNGGVLAKWSRTERRAFGAAVTQEIKGIDSGSPSAKKAAARLRQVYAEIGAGAKEAQVKGFEDFVADGKYVPRVPDRQKIVKSIETYGRPAIIETIANAIRKGYADLEIDIDPKLLARMADGYFARLNDLALGIENEALAGLRLTDVDQIAATLRSANVDEATISDTVLRLRNGLQKEGGEGTPRYSKSRTMLDEDMVQKVFSKDIGREVEVSLRDILFLDDAEALFQTYNHSMSGWTSLARDAGIKSKADHQKLMDAVRTELPQKEGAKVASALDDAYKFIIGQPLFDTSRWQTARRWGRALRDYQFARTMNMVGFANVPDSAAFLTPQYMRFLGRHLPDLADIMSRAKDGTLNHQLARQLEEWIGGGTDMLHNKLFSAFDDEPTSKLSKLEHGIRVAARITERNPLGIGPITTFTQRLTEIAISQRLVDNVLGTADNLKLKHWNKMGIDDNMLARLRKEFEGGAVEIDSGKLKSLDFASFKDTEARDALMAAIHRESRRLVQEEDFSDTYPFMHSAIGKMVIQFRRFGLVSYTKQFYRAAADRDLETATRLAFQVSLGSASYAAQMYLYSLTKGEDAQEWRDKYLTPQRIFFGGIARAGMFSLTPMLLENVWQAATGTEGVFSNTRTTGLAAGAVAGIPAFDFMSRTLQATSGIAQNLRDDRQFDKKDYSNLRLVLPFQNMIVIKQLLDVMGNSLPEDDEDDDSSVATFPIIGDVRQKSE